ncbi:MAG: DMT family transporter [Bryobacterales bacterium]|nr:DMT family transporter [Bryobacterales bacterium]
MPAALGMSGWPERSRSELALVAVTILWGATFVVVKNAIEQASTLVFLAMRFSLASAALLLMFRRRLRWQGHLRWISLQGGLLAGLCLMLGYFFQTLGLRYTTPSKSAFVTGLTTVLVPFLSALVYRRAPHLSEGIGVVVATAGLALLTHPGGRFNSFAIGYGDALTLCCAVAFACHILVLGRWSPVSSFELLSVTQILVTAFLALAVCGWAEPVKLVWSRQLVSGVVITGLLATAVAFTVQTWAQRYTTPTRAALIFALEPVSAAVTAFFAAGDVLAGRALLGAALILAGVLIVELKPVGASRHLLE